jgi:erythronate-4-phosphate dehydrogenase
MNILADATLPGLTQAFPEPFQLTCYEHIDEVSQLLPGQDILLCRSTLKVHRDLLKKNSLSYVATATSGTDHLDHSFLASQNIQIIDAKGCNASAVADYVVSVLAYLSQHNLIKGTKAGIIGLGKVGTQVRLRLQAAGFEVLNYDPLKALPEPYTSCLFEELYQVDLLCIHAELHNTFPYPSLNLIDQNVLSKLKPGCVLINAARGGIVNEEALLHTQNHLIYCTDVYLNEPELDKRILTKSTLCTPHIAGHSLEAKYLAVAMVSESLHQQLGLPFPKWATPQINNHLPVLPHSNWQQHVLSIYNPFEETFLFKNALDTKSAFLQLRKKHHRHDFQIYDHKHLDKKQALLVE